jgi:Protein of unknown function (DUF2809)
MKIKYRCLYLLVAIIILLTEILIAVYVHDSLIRPYGGDILAVVLVYCSIRVFILRSLFIPAVLSFGCACVIEILQAFHLTAVPWIASNKILAIVLGSTFDYNDILSYGAGALSAFIIDTAIRKKVDACCCAEES